MDIVPKSVAFCGVVLMELPTGLLGGSSWDGHDTTRCCSSRVQLSAFIKGSGNAKVWVLEKAILTVARGIVL